MNSSYDMIRQAFNYCCVRLYYINKCDWQRAAFQNNTHPAKKSLVRFFVWLFKFSSSPIAYSCVYTPALWNTMDVCCLVPSSLASYAGGSNNHHQQKELRHCFLCLQQQWKLLASFSRAFCRLLTVRISREVKQHFFPIDKTQRPLRKFVLTSPKIVTAFWLPNERQQRAAQLTLHN